MTRRSKLVVHRPVPKIRKLSHDERDDGGELATISWIEEGLVSALKKGGVRVRQRRSQGWMGGIERRAPRWAVEAARFLISAGWDVKRVARLLRGSRAQLEAELAAVALAPKATIETQELHLHRGQANHDGILRLARAILLPPRANIRV